MRVEAAKVILRLPHTTSLKDKRSILKSLIARIHRDFQVAIAEVGELDDFRKAILGVAFVSNNSKLNDGVIQQLLALIEQSEGIVLEETQRDFLSL